MRSSPARCLEGCLAGPGLGKGCPLCTKLLPTAKSTRPPLCSVVPARGCAGSWSVCPWEARQPGSAGGGCRGVPARLGSPRSWEGCGGGDLGGLGSRVGDSRRSSGPQSQGGGSQESQRRSGRGVRRVGGPRRLGGPPRGSDGEAERGGGPHPAPRQPRPARIGAQQPGRREDVAIGAAHTERDSRSERGLGRDAAAGGPHCPLTGPLGNPATDPPLSPARPQPACPLSALADGRALPLLRNDQPKQWLGLPGLCGSVPIGFGPCFETQWLKSDFCKTIIWPLSFFK